MAQGDWRYAVIKGLGGRVTPQTLSFLSGWQRKEGGHTNNAASWNWLNRTDKGYPTMNKVGVAAYPNYQTGVARTVALIQSGYPALAAGLRSGNVAFNDPGVQGDLNRWLTGNRQPGMTPYVQSVAKLAGLPSGAGAPAPAPPAAPPRQLANFVPLLAALSDRRQARSAGQRPDIGPMLGAIMGLRQKAVQQPTAAPQQGTPAMASPQGALQAPVSPTGTHVTSGLGWGTRTAQDIMAKPGTAVSSPVSGTIVYFHPTGAQGGGSMLLRSDDGHEYWLGHIANGLPAGTRVRQGQVISYVSGDHPRPHLHIDRR